MAVSNVSSGQKAQDLSKDAKSADLKDQQRLGHRALEDQITKQSQEAGAAAQSSALIAQLQAAQLQSSGQPGGNALDTASPEVQAAAKSVAKEVLSQIMNQQAAPSPQAGNAGTGSGAEEQGAAATALGNVSASDPAAAEADQKIQDAAKVAVYQNIQGMLQKMQSTNQTRTDLDNAISAINMKMANAKPGETINGVPVYQVDPNSGQVKFMGTQTMTTEQAQAMRDSLTNQKDSLADLSSQDMLRLQQLMDQKSQLESMISNVMKANSDTQSGLAAALKAS